MIHLSDESQRLTSTFLTYRNDIDIYTEDNEKDKEFYKVLFKRLLRNDISINDVTTLGSKSNVIKRCEEEPDNGRKKIFIIDGDVTIIHGKNIPNIPNLYVLDAYCIENFLINKETALHFVYMSCGVKSEEDIENELDFDNWINSYSETLINLFIHFAIVNFFGGYFTLFNANKYHIKENNQHVYKPELVEIDILALKQEILLLTSEQEYTAKYLELSNKWAHSIDNLLTVVSGKDYLIPILLFKSTQFKSSNSLPKLEEVKFSLVHMANLSKLDKLKEIIEKL